MRHDKYHTVTTRPATVQCHDDLDTTITCPAKTSANYAMPVSSKKRP